MNASASGHLDVVKLLSAHPGADVHVSDKVNFCRPRAFLCMDISRKF